MQKDWALIISKYLSLAEMYNRTMQIGRGTHLDRDVLETVGFAKTEEKRGCNNNIN